MRTLNIVALSAVSPEDSRESSPINSGHLTKVSVIGVVADAASPVGTLKLQGSNDIAEVGHEPSFTPTTWADVPDAAAAVADNGTFVIEKADLCYRFIRVVYERTSGGTDGTLTAKVMAQGW